MKNGTRLFVAAVAWCAMGQWTLARAAWDASAFTTPAVHFGDRDAEASAALGKPSVWNVTFGAPGSEAAQGPTRGPGSPDSSLLDSQAAQGEPAARRRPVAFVYSDGYALRAKIHKYASFATLPIFGAQALLGYRLDEGSASEGVRATHAALATTMVGLFGVNTVTGVWNLWEARKDPAGRTKRIVHSILMLGADAGFIATGLTAPTNDGGGDRSLHTTMAITSIGTATAGYLLMLLTN